jgi:hypothetical protein
MENSDLTNENQQTEQSTKSEVWMYARVSGREQNSNEGSLTKQKKKIRLSAASIGLNITRSFDDSNKDVAILPHPDLTGCSKCGGKLVGYVNKKMALNYSICQTCNRISMVNNKNNTTL